MIIWFTVYIISSCSAGLKSFTGHIWSPGHSLSVSALHRRWHWAHIFGCRVPLVVTAVGVSSPGLPDRGPARERMHVHRPSTRGQQDGRVHRPHQALRLRLWRQGNVLTYILGNYTSWRSQKRGKERGRERASKAARENVGKLFNWWGHIGF